MNSRIDMVKALIKARGEFSPVLKDAKNPFHKSQYATLEGVLAAVTPALLNNGLLLLQPITEGAEGMVVLTQLWHESGEKMEFPFKLPAQSDMQKLGSAITYARRYSVLALLGIAPEDDDDGNSTAAPAKASTNGVKQTPAATVATRGNGSPSTPKRIASQANEVNARLENLVGALDGNGKPPIVPAPSSSYDWDNIPQ